MVLFSVQTDVFEGPLDLLLYLVKRDGIDVRQIQVSRVADAYLETLERMRELNLSIASDYLVMAATLTHLKSLELLPRLPTILEDEDEDPREALTRQLLEYERFKRAAEDLDQHILEGRDVFTRQPEQLAAADRPVYSPIDAFGLLDLFYDVLKRSQKKETASHIIHHSGADVITCCRRLIRRMGGKGGHLELGSVLRGIEEPGERVVTFIGALEMSRLQWVRIEQEGHLAPVIVTALVDEDVDFARVTGEVVQEAS